MSPINTREWLKPKISTSSLYNSVGAPWEIYRPFFLTSEPRPIDHYTKEGDLPQKGYAATVIIVPEYEIGTTILVAGNDAYDASIILFNTIQGFLIPVLEAEARSQAALKYAGKYTSNCTESGSELELVIDSGPGLKITEWKNLGKDMLLAFDSVLFGGNGMRLDARIYPIGVDERWRVTFEEESEADEVTLTSTACRTWEQVDQFRYAGLPTDEFDFEVRNGSVVSVMIPDLRAELLKV